METIKTSEIKEDDFAIIQEDAVVVRATLIQGKLKLIVWCDVSEWAGSGRLPHLQIDKPMEYIPLEVGP